MADVLAYTAAAAVALWGVSHAVPTREVVAGFEPRAILVEEWAGRASRDRTTGRVRDRAEGVVLINDNKEARHAQSRSALGDRRS